MASAREPVVHATIYAVAERAGVSTATVSRALAGSTKVAPGTRDAVIAAARELDYLPTAAASALAGRRTRALGLVLPHVDGAYYAELLVGFEIEASHRGLSVVITLANPREDAEGTVRGLASKVDGIAFMARSAATDDLIARTAPRLPVVTIARPRIPGRDALFSENRRTARELTERLLGAGRVRPAFIGRPERGSDLGMRHLGVLDAMSAAGLPAPGLLACDPVEDQGVAAAEHLLSEGMPYDALICGNDELALAVMRHLQDRGVQVPDDVAITGWDDTTTAAYVRPGLTSVVQPVRALGALAAQRLTGLVDGTAPDDVPTVLASRIVHRGSCGCAGD